MSLLRFFLILVILLGWVSSGFASTTSGLSYLRTKQGSDGHIGGSSSTSWAVMAFSTSGERNTQAVEALRSVQLALSGRSATDIEKQILGLVAAGENPRTFAGVNAIDLLKSKISGNQIGEADLLNDDIFGILALQAAREPISATLFQTLASHQQSDGGWGIYTSGSTSTDMTAVALIALNGHVTQPIIESGVTYIKARQNDDGGFASVSGASTIGSTAWVDWMIVSLGYSYPEKNGRTPRDYLWTMQSSDGSWSNSVLLTSYALIALSQKGFPYRGIVATPSPTPTPNPTPLPSLTPKPSLTPTPYTLNPNPSSRPSTQILAQNPVSGSPKPNTSPARSSNPFIPKPSSSPSPLLASLPVAQVLQTFSPRPSTPQPTPSLNETEPPRTLQLQPKDKVTVGALLALLVFHTTVTGFAIIDAKKQSG
jgi:hypothetical protein